MKQKRPCDWNSLPLILTAADVERITGLSRPLVYQVLGREDFPTIRVSERRLVVARDKFKSWLDKQTNETA